MLKVKSGRSRVIPARLATGIMCILFFNGYAFGLQPLSYRMDFFNSKSEYKDGKQGVSLNSESLSYSTGDSFSLPVGGYPATLSVNGTETENLAGSSISKNSHINISASSMGANSTLATGFNETKTGSRTPGLPSAETVSKNSSISISMNEPYLPPLDIGFSEAETAGNKTSSTRFSTSFKVSSMNLFFNRYANKTESAQLRGDESTRTTLEVSNSKNISQYLSLTNSFGIDRSENKSGGFGNTNGSIRRLGSSFSYTGLKDVNLSGNYSMVSEKSTTAQGESGKKYSTLSLFSTVRLSDGVYVNLSRTTSNQSGPAPSENIAESDNITITKYFDSRLSLSFSHNSQKNRRNNPAGASSATESSSLSVNTLLGGDIRTVFNFSGAGAQKTMDMRVVFDLTPQMPVSYYFADSANTITHSINFQIPLTQTERLYLTYSSKEESSRKSRSLSYSYSGMLTNGVGYNLSISDQNDTQGGAKKSFSLNLNMPAGGGNYIDLSMSLMESLLIKNSTFRIGMSGTI